jgi:hypothetical protein
MHPDDVIIIVQEGEFQRCPHCRMFLKSITPRHVVSQTCRAQATRIQEREKVATLAQLARNVKFFVNGEYQKSLDFRIRLW